MSNYSVSLKGIGIENFKAFGEYQHFDLAPLTIITGPNNSGKSALVSALELLSKNDIYSHLDFHSNGLDIGDLSQVVNSKSKSKKVEFELNFKINPSQKFVENVILHIAKDFSIRLVYEKSIIKRIELKILGEPRLSIDYLDNHTHSITPLIFEAKIDFEYFIQKYLADYELNYQNSLLEKPPGLLSRPNGCFADSFVHTREFYGPGDSFNGEMFNSEDLVKFPSLNNVKSLIAREMSGSQQISCNQSFDNKLIFGIERDISEPSYYSRHNRGQYNNSNGIISGIIEELLNLSGFDSYDNNVNRFESIIIKHLKSNGEKFDLVDIGKCPEFSNPFNSFVETLGTDLMNLLLLAKTEIQKSIKLEALRATNDRIYQYKQQQIPLTREIISAAESTDRTKQSEFFKRWTGNENFKFFENPRFNKIEGFGYRFVVTKDGADRELPDLGFGTRQVIPVILGLFNNKEVPFIVEEPESNLHPRLQSLLADLFVEVKKEYPESPLIIETHSEYLIRKLQYLVASQEISPESIAIHYIGEDKGKGRDIFKINIERDGSLDRSFGPGFFDEATNWKFELMRIKHEQKN